MATTTNRPRESILYGLVGLLLGVILMGVFASYAVNNNHPGMMGAMGMSRNNMAGDNLNKRFIEEMIPHHESAIDMAKLAEQKAVHSEIKTLAGGIIASQTDEINKMKQWYKSWYGTDVPEGTNSTMMSNEEEVASLNAADEFDQAFLENMIPHHQMAVMMANMLERGTNRPEMKQLAAEIENAQTEEINQMQSWQSEWGYAITSQSSDMHMMR